MFSPKVFFINPTDVKFKCIENLIKLVFIQITDTLNIVLQKEE